MTVTITIELPDDTNTDLVAAICGNHGYQANIPNPNPQFIDGVAVEGWTPTIPNPQTMGQFAISKLVNWGVENIVAYKKNVAASIAVAAVVPPDISTVVVNVT